MRWVRLKSCRNIQNYWLVVYKKDFNRTGKSWKKHLNFGRVDDNKPFDPFEVSMNKIIKTKKICSYHNITDKYQLERAIKEQCEWLEKCKTKLQKLPTPKCFTSINRHKKPCGYLNKSRLISVSDLRYLNIEWLIDRYFYFYESIYSFEWDERFFFWKIDTPIR